jgi:hypothetical protein
MRLGSRARGLATLGRPVPPRSEARYRYEGA